MGGYKLFCNIMPTLSVEESGKGLALVEETQDDGEFIIFLTAKHNKRKRILLPVTSFYDPNKKRNLGVRSFTQNA